MIYIKECLNKILQIIKNKVRIKKLLFFLNIVHLILAFDRTARYNLKKKDIISIVIPHEQKIILWTNYSIYTQCFRIFWQSIVYLEMR